ncbi:phage antirepressor KilAC domain-containing protein [Ligilactobacillus salivarius]|uniref:phage antirepressor KilAC domain-containing protein n=1 Tax=Ligilactobacillus salivarius TaxID=1624 RepID=UPI0009D93A69|nr:phage antirepressor KilAC domain-containing protein [Ligilactobacillus salivarius]ATP34809.1 oxidoreductase [Ligilactobacillus salivarius]OQR05131.1 oxidoreductase [Ligilactobacillus salivarius]
MNELIKVKTKEDMQIVSARDLYEVLGVKTRFSQWAKQNFKHFRENIDFTSVVTTTLVNNGAKRELQDYALTIEMAKHIAMMSGTDKGYEIRDYFIKVEQAWNSPEMVMKRALEIANKKVEQLKIENQAMKSKALFADSVAASHTTILIGELAKILRGNGINIGANRLFQWMRDQGYLISRKGTDYNMPTQRSMNLGLFKIKESTITHSNGSVSISKTTKVTGKGQQYFINKFMKMNETA